MPAATSGKRNMKTLYADDTGASASQRVRSAEWRSGQLNWKPSNHASSSSSACSAETWQAVSVDYEHPWFELRGQDYFKEYYCLLCNAWAREDHVGSGRHQKRAEHPEWFLVQGKW